MHIRLLILTGLALLMLVTAGAEQPSLEFLKQEVVQNRKTDSETKQWINEALKAFEELLEVSKNAAAMNSHWRVRLESWRNAQEDWEKAEQMLPAPIKRLKHCAVPLGTARKRIEHADNLFNRARDNKDTLKAAKLLDHHQSLLKQAQGPLRRAERCYRSLLDVF